MHHVTHIPLFVPCQCACCCHCRHVAPPTTCTLAPMQHGAACEAVRGARPVPERCQVRPGRRCSFVLNTVLLLDGRKPGHSGCAEREPCRSRRLLALGFGAVKDERTVKAMSRSGDRRAPAPRLRTAA